MKSKTNITFINRNKSAYKIYSINNQCNTEFELSANQTRTEPSLEDQQWYLENKNKQFCTIKKQKQQTIFLVPNFPALLSNIETSIKIKNKTNENLQLYWRKNSQEQVFYQSLQAQQMIEQHTYVGHQWNLRCKHFIFFIIASLKDQQYIIKQQYLDLITSKGIENGKSGKQQIKNTGQEKQIKLPVLSNNAQIAKKINMDNEQEQKKSKNAQQNSKKIQKKLEKPKVEININKSKQRIRVIEEKQIKQIHEQKNIELKKPIKKKKLNQLITFQFKKEGQTILTGQFSTQKTNGKDVLNIQNADCYMDFGIVSLWYQNFCYTDGRYNCNEYKVENGKLGDKLCFKIYPPAKQFKEFLASQHCLAYKFSQKVDYVIYKFQDKCLEIADEISAAKIIPKEYTLLPSLKISKLGKPFVFLVEKKSIKISPFTSLSDKAQGAIVFQDNNILVQLVKYQIPEEPYYPQCFQGSPSSHQNLYAPNRDFFYFRNDQIEYCVWMNKQNTNIYLTKIQTNKYVIKTIQLQSIKTFILGAATGDSKYVYYTIVQSGQSQDKTKFRKMYLYKASLDSGKVILSQSMPTNKQNINIFHFDTCNMTILKDTLAVTISRKMTKGPDGLNHQGAIAAVFSSETLKLLKNHGQTSGHSFASSVIARKDKFCGIDLGDNYPRGINYWVFDKSTMDTKVVYCFKTEHGKQAKSPAGVTYPEYSQISKGKDKFYKWSNDNKTYTELGAPGIIQDKEGIIIIFCGQNKPSPLDSSNTSKYLNCSRNLGFVKVKKQIEKQIILSQGIQEKGGYFSFGGAWMEQKNKGIRWLTNFAKNQNASRVKAVRLQEKVFVIYEIWNQSSYLRTQYMLVSLSGEVIQKSKIIDFKIRLHKSDDIYQNYDSVVIFAGEKGRILKRYEIRSN